MGRRTTIIAALLLTGVLVSPAQAGPNGGGSSNDAGEAPATLALPPPDGYTDELHRRILAAGPRGVEVPLSTFAGGQSSEPELDCLGYSPPSVSTGGVSLQAVSAGGCMVSPHGCTMNFVFTDGTSNYIGTAGHCVQSKGTVVMQVATRVDPTDTVFVTLAAVGKTVKRVNQGIGRDFALVKVNPGFKVVPGVAGALGPTGVFCGDPVGQPVVHYGHGYVFAVGPGVAKEGEVVPDLTLVFKFASPRGFNWVGYGLPGDSGSGVMDAAGLAVGDLTHGLSVLGLPVPGLNFGTDMGGIFEIIGSGYSLVTADGRAAKCPGGLVGL